MKYSEIKQIKNFCDDYSINDWKEVVNNIENSDEDFEIENYRFIHKDYIDAIQIEELESDSYALGCFNADFIANNTDLSYEIVRCLQKNEEYSIIGQHIIDNNYTEEMQQEYARLDGYGHHFAHYDSETIEDLLNLDYYAFRVD